MWGYDFMQHALIAGLIVSTICAVVSVFVVLRRSAFAAHALSHMSLTGAAGAMLVGVSAITGQLIINITAAIIMGLLGDKVKKNDLIIGVVLTFVLGLGAYFLFLFQNNYAGNVMNILFGNILSVSISQIYQLLFLSFIVVIIYLICARPLLFMSVDPTLAIAKNLPIRVLSIVFFISIAITVSMACQIVGALLVFSLLVIPGAIADQWCDRFYASIGLSVIVANISLIIALYLAYQFNLPVSVCITSFMSFMYLIGLIRKLII